ncbi:Hsp20/alpha crystallin family protein [Ornithinibacillus bavariensis]|uniref:Hsp20/alpha crystallin family protein n=1 Tax=Ornithinibacillus bavariensis TaxID=545502 RepID=UPI000EE1C885|nr:heat-shock protein [Ornithinibacillus sp.]
MGARRNRLPGRFDIDMTPLHDFMRQMDSFFNQSFKQMNEQFQLKPFWVDMYEKDSHFVVKAELGDYTKEQIQIEASGNQLRIRVDDNRIIKEEDTKQQTLFSRQSFHRKEQVVNLPFDIPQNKIKASFKNQILTITIPKPESMKRRLIEIDDS